MNAPLLVIVSLFSSSAVMVGQTEDFLPGGIPPEAVRALPAPQSETSRDSLSRSNVANLSATPAIAKTIQPISGGARADFGLQKTFFPVDVKDGGPVVITTPDARQLSFRATFLALHDLSTDQSLLIAEVTNRVGSIIGANQVIYTNAFDTLRADIRYRYTAQSVEQDIILHEHPAIPKEFSPENTRLEIWTEWFNSAPLSKSIQSIDLRADESSGLLPPSLIQDEGLNFGTMKIVTGHAFSSTAQDEQTPVGKSWVRVEGRDWLIETVDYMAVKSKLDLLPSARRTASYSQPQSKRDAMIRSLARYSPPLRRNDARMLMAEATQSRQPEFVMDFIIVSSVPLPPDAVSWWPAGGNANDVITNNHGTLYNGGTYAAGKVGQAIRFDGNNDHVRIPNQPNLRFTNSVTFEGWIYPTNVSWYREILSKWDAVWGYNQKSFDCSLYPGGQFYILVSPGGTDTGSAYVLSSNAVPVNTWTHVAGTYDGTTLKVYLNGVLDKEGAYSNGIFPGTNSLGIGAATGGASPGSMLTPFPGMIDEPTLYARALSDSEIQAIYNAGAAGKHNPQCMTTPANIVGWWPGDGNTYDLARTNFAVLNAGATYGAAMASHGFSFDGSDDYVEVPNAPDLNPTNAITLEAWVYQTGNQSQNLPIFSKDNPSSTRQYLLTVASSGKFRAHVWRNPGGIAYFDGITTVQLNTWYHVAMTYDGTNLLLYVNGIADAGTAATGSIVTSTEPLRIGGSYSGGWGNYKFAGLIDEPTVYNRALTATEVSALYAAGSAGKCKVDTDGDGLTDLQETFLGTSTNNTDSDNDGLSDGDEVFVHHTNAIILDTDGDELSDGWEIEHGTNPTTANAAVRFVAEPKATSNIP